MSVEDELAAAQAKLDMLEQRTKDQRRYRNHMIRKAFAEGVTWSKVREITGLSLRGIQISVKDSTD